MANKVTLEEQLSGKRDLRLIPVSFPSGKTSEFSPGKHNELQKAVITADIIFVTAFLYRKTFRQFDPDIAWETEVWIAEAPDHVIHFDGDKFLGPYSPKPSA